MSKHGSAFDALLALAKRQSTVAITWHEGHAKWEVCVDGRRVLPDECEGKFWAHELSDAIGQAHDWIDTL